MTSLRSLASLPLFGILPARWWGRRHSWVYSPAPPCRLCTGSAARSRRRPGRRRSRSTARVRARDAGRDADAVVRARRTPRGPGAWRRARGCGPRARGGRRGTGAGRRPAGDRGSRRARRPGRWPRRRSWRETSTRSASSRCEDLRLAVPADGGAQDERGPGSSSAIQPHFWEAKVDALMVRPSTGGTRKPLPVGQGGQVGAAVGEGDQGHGGVLDGGELGGRGRVPRRRSRRRRPGGDGEDHGVGVRATRSAAHDPPAAGRRRGAARSPGAPVRISPPRARTASATASGRRADAALDAHEDRRRSAGWRRPWPGSRGRPRSGRCACARPRRAGGRPSASRCGRRRPRTPRRAAVRRGGRRPRGRGGRRRTRRPPRRRRPRCGAGRRRARCGRGPPSESTPARARRGAGDAHDVALGHGAQGAAGPDRGGGGGGRLEAVAEAHLAGEGDGLGAAREHRLGAEVDAGARDLAGQQLAADPVGRLQDGDARPAAEQPVGGGQSRDAASDDDDMSRARDPLRS